MAGTYPDVPGNRIAYDLNGTIAVKISAAGDIVQLDQTALNEMRDESLGTDNGGNAGFGARIYGNGRMAMIFPCLMDIDGLYLAIGGYAIGTPTDWQTSTDTTNGQDGTWTNITSPPILGTGISIGTGTDGVVIFKPYYRSQIWSGNLPGIKAIRFRLPTSWGDGSIPCYHLYGRPSTGESPDRLEIWHPTLDERVDGAYFDWGDAQRTTNETRTFRIKNLSPTLTATTIDITFEVLSDSSPSYDAMHTLSDGGAFTDTITVASLAPGAISGTLTFKRDFLANATLGIWAGRIKTTVTSWT